jgi:hypothetical protein
MAICNAGVMFVEASREYNADNRSAATLRTHAGDAAVAFLWRKVPKHEL